MNLVKQKINIDYAFDKAQKYTIPNGFEEFLNLFFGKKLKVSIGSKFIDGPYGGGNLFVKNLSKYLLDNNVDVVYDLNDIDIDIILIVNPLKNSENVYF